MAFANKIRLPIHLNRPQFPVEEDVYTRANGKRIVTNATVFKELEGKTDWMPKEWHERLSIALRHDEVSITSQNFTGAFRISGSYEIEWQDFLDYPLAPAKFKGFEDGFSARSNLCNTCAASSQLGLVDDFVNVAEGESYEFNVASNDFIGCGTPVFEVMSFNATYVESATINGAGVLSITMKDTIPSLSQVNLVIYQVTCGSEKATATVIGGMTGSGIVCQQAENLTYTMDENATLPVELTVEWEEPDTVPTRWFWQIEKLSDGSVIGSGNTTDLSFIINALEFNTGYRLRHHGVCQPDPSEPAELSIPVIVDFTTPEAPSGVLPHEAQEITIETIATGSEVEVKATMAAGIAVKDNVVISGTVTIYAPFASTHTFTLVILNGQLSGSSSPISIGGTMSGFSYGSVSHYPEESEAVTGDKIMDLTLYFA